MLIYVEYMVVVSGPDLPIKGWGEIERGRSGQLPTL